MIRDPVAAHAEAAIRRGSKSFSRAAQLLRARTREGAHQLYAWCRHCDDTIDNQILGQGRRGPAEGRDAQRAALEQLRRTTVAALDGSPMQEPVFVGLQRVAREYRIPRELPFALLDGMGMDVEGRRYATLDELVVYCHHVAGVVGQMMAYVMDASDPATLALARDLGIAFQLTNIARDVMDDAAVGRVYLPLDWLLEAGLDASQVAEPEHRAAVAAVVGRLLREADRYYARADRGISHLPFRSAWSIAAARGIYAEIGRLIERRGVRAWDRRAVVPRWRKTWWVLRGLLRAARRSSEGA